VGWGLEALTLFVSDGQSVCLSLTLTCNLSFALYRGSHC